MDLLTQHAGANGAKAAVIVDAAGGGRPSATTFAELNAHGEPARPRAARARGATAATGSCGAGPNSLEVLATIHAARKAGLVAVPLSYRFNAEEMAVRHRQLRRDVVVVDAEQAPLVADGPRPSSRRCATSSSSAATRPTGCVELGRRARRRSPTPTTGRRRRPTRAPGAAMIYTSGTTGKPKGALRTAHRPARSSSRCSAELDLLQPGTRCTSRPGRCTTRARSRSRRSSHTLGGTDRRAAQVRRRPRGSSS